METQTHVKPLMVSQNIKVTAYDIDVMGIVSNIVYVRWMEDLRMLFLEKYWPFTEMLERKESPILANTTIDYIKPVTIFDKPVGQLWMQEIGKVKWTVAMEILVNDEIYCRATQTGYFINMQKNKIIRLPKELATLYKQAQNI